MENSTMTDEQLMRQAEEVVKARRGFRSHLMIYFCVNIGLVIIYFITSSGNGRNFSRIFDSYFWPIWSILGWGVGVIVHGIGVYGKLPGKTLEEEVQLEYKRLKNKMD